MKRVLRQGGTACYARAMTTISRRSKSATRKAGGQNAEREGWVGRDDAEVVRSLRRQARQFEAVLADARASEPVKAEARRKRQEILEFLRKNSWRSPDGTQKCVRAVTKAIKRPCGRLAQAVGHAARQFWDLHHAGTDSLTLGKRRELSSPLTLPSPQRRGWGEGESLTRR